MPRTIGPARRWGKKDEVEGQVQRAGRLQLATVDVDHVAQRHEGVEGDGDGERHLEERDGAPEPQGMGEVVDVDRDEAVVLEPPEQAQQAGAGESHGQPPGPFACAAETAAPPTKAMVVVATSSRQ